MLAAIAQLAVIFSTFNPVSASRETFVLISPKISNIVPLLLFHTIFIDIIEGVDYE
jgi:hypothetical protein